MGGRSCHEEDPTHRGCAVPFGDWPISPVYGFSLYTHLNNLRDLCLHNHLH